ncbi:hypothetical protein PsorP6_002712 [Peronosclerospora sorghi]|uniref:Uncharacterized protein n=1 Tax=Peronosclerospora sorghi TaxID=230839 RepID=A0ACC0WUH4_9STRA|nr:hypothetical protein PsorP6_002712 [Peronosclerospora sorghi]
MFRRVLDPSGKILFGCGFQHFLIIGIAFRAMNVAELQQSMAHRTLSNEVNAFKEQDHVHTLAYPSNEPNGRIRHVGHCCFSSCCTRSRTDRLAASSTEFGSSSSSSAMLSTVSLRTLLTAPIDVRGTSRTGLWGGSLAV